MSGNEQPQYPYDSIEVFVGRLEPILRSFYESNPQTLVSAVSAVKGCVAGTQDLSDNEILERFTSALHNLRDAAPAAVIHDPEPKSGGDDSKSKSRDDDSELNQEINVNKEGGDEDVSVLKTEESPSVAVLGPPRAAGSSSARSSSGFSLDTASAACFAADAFLEAEMVNSKVSSMVNPIPVHHPTQGTVSSQDEQSAASEKKPPAKKQKRECTQH